MVVLWRALDGEGAKSMKAGRLPNQKAVARVHTKKRGSGLLWTKKQSKNPYPAVQGQGGNHRRGDGRSGKAVMRGGAKGIAGIISSTKKSARCNYLLSILTPRRKPRQRRLRYSPTQKRRRRSLWWGGEKKKKGENMSLFRDRRPTLDAPRLGKSRFDYF